MPWTRLDDGLDEHRKVEALIEDNELRGLAAVGLWTLTLTNSNRRLTDGEVSKGTLRKLAPRHGAGLAKQLVAVRLYDQPGAYAIHDFLDYNPSRESVEEKRRRDSERKASGRSNRGPKGIHAESDRNPSGVQADSARPVPIPIPLPPSIPPFNGGRQRDKDRRQEWVKAVVADFPDPATAEGAAWRAVSRGVESADAIRAFVEQDVAA